MLQAGALSEVDLDNLLKSVTEQEVVIGCVRDFQLCLIESHLSRGALGWCLGLTLSIDFSGWI